MYTVGLFCKHSLVPAIDVSTLWILGREAVVGGVVCVVLSAKKATTFQRCATWLLLFLYALRCLSHDGSTSKVAAVLTHGTMLSATSALGRSSIKEPAAALCIRIRSIMEIRWTMVNVCCLFFVWDVLHWRSWYAYSIAPWCVVVSCRKPAGNSRTLKRMFTQVALKWPCILSRHYWLLFFLWCFIYFYRNTTFDDVEWMSKSFGT